MENLEMIKLSIIVPIYGVEPYLRKCVDSLLVQDMASTEYEIILVDDESPDLCPQICDEYVANHSNIRVIHRKNGGLSAARNTGIKAAKGEYICFADSDDYWEPNVLGRLMAQVDIDNLDVLRYRFQYVNSQYQTFSPFANPFRGNNYSEKPTDGITFLNTRMNTQCYAWTYIIQRDIVPFFTEGIHFEDVDWTPKMLLNAKRVSSTSLIVYNYLIREGSITQEANNVSKRVQNAHDALDVIARLNTLINTYPRCIWLLRMRSDIAMSIINTTAVYLYTQCMQYLNALQKLNVFPLTAPYPEVKTRCKVWMINFSPRTALFIKYLLKSHSEGRNDK